MPFSTGEEDLFHINQQEFDFNVQFEQLFFSIIPSVLFIVTSLWRTLSQSRKPTVVNAPAFQLVKLGAIATYVGLELSLVILVAVGSFRVTSMFIASSVLKLTSALFMVVLSVVDHSRSPRPSVLLNSYLFLSLLLDAAQSRTLFLSSGDRPELTYSSVFTATIALKVGILLLEAQRKARWLKWDDEEHSPEETSGIFSLGVFFWLNRMFLKGYSKILHITDLYPLDTSLSGRLLHEQFSRHVDHARLEGDRFGLVKALMRTLAVPLLLPIPPRLALLGFTFCQPFFIEKLVDHLSQPELDANVGYGLIGASVLIYSGMAVSTALYSYFHHRMRTMARSMLVTEIFIKATQARIGAGDDGAALTLMSTDMERIKLGFRSLHDMWASAIQVALAGWMLYDRLGVAFVVPVGAVAACFAGLAVLMRLTGDSQRAWMAGVQRRVGMTASVVAGMKSLKISGLSAAAGDFIQQLRVDELSAGSRFRKILIVAALLGYIPLLLSPPLTLAFAQRTLDPSRMFTSLSYLLLLTDPLSQIFQTIPQLLSALACLGRVQAFLESEARHDFRRVLADARASPEKARVQGGESPTASQESQPDRPDLEHAVAVAIRDGRFGWEADRFALRDVNTQVAKSSLTIVVGPVGSGKSTLCKALLGEIPFSEGSVVLSTRHPRVGFCDQTPFLSNGSVRDNIVGHSPFDAERYAEVIEATALGVDLAALPRGDGSGVGSDGVTLSGGQRQRVSLARALYLRADLLVLDDVFSGLDADTEERVFRRALGPGGLLRRRRCTVVLCTHSVRHLPAADHVVALGGGTVVEQGTFDQLVAGRGYVQRLGLSGAPAEADDGSSSSEEAAASRKGTPEPPEPPGPPGPRLLRAATTRSAPPAAPGLDESRRAGDRTVYKHYFKSMGWLLAGCSVVFGASWGFFTNFPTIWLKYWSDDVSSAHQAHPYAYYAGIYALLQVCALLSLLLLGIALLIVSVTRAGAHLHRDALETLTRAPLRFFTTTDNGVVTNLFSQDLNLVDTELPTAVLNTLFCVFQALGQAAVILTSSLYFAISYPFLCALLYIVQRFYLRTSRQLRLLDLEAKSPLYTHFLDTVRGIATLRAFGFIAEDVDKNLRLIDSSQRAAYLLLMIQSWLTLVLNIVVMVMAALLTTLAVRLHANSGFAGASLVTLMSFGDNLAGIVTFYTSLETSIGAIARLKTFSETVRPEEKEDEDVVPPEQWPRHGLVELKGISASYSPEDEHEDGDGDGDGDAPRLALRDIHLTVRPGEKVAICGRTGSGKSSLVALLLKLLEPLPGPGGGGEGGEGGGGTAAIDGTPLRRVDRPALRRRVIAMPQEAVFLPEGATFRENLDPLGLSAPGECRDALAAVGLWELVRGRGGLGAGMSAGALSAGQRQLVSLGRAVLRRRVRARNAGVDGGGGGGGGGGSEGGLLLLDEVSSSVDRETERVIQEIIRSEFQSYTVIAVSHRLDMIMDFDRVVVMDTGEIVEVGNPRTLAGTAGTRFGDLVRAGGK